VRAGSEPSVMKKMFIAERDRQYSVCQEIKKCEDSYNYLVSDNPACAGAFLSEKYTPKPHDDSNISRCRAEALKFKEKLNAICAKLAAHDGSLFSSRTGKLQTGLTCHHDSNSNTLHSIRTGSQKNIDHLLEELKCASQKYKSTHFIGSKTKASKSRKKKEDKRKAMKRTMVGLENRKQRACVIFVSLGGTTIEGEYEPEKFGVPQIENVDEEILSLFTSRTDKACLGDLLNSKCFSGEAEDKVQHYLY